MAERRPKKMRIVTRVASKNDLIWLVASNCYARGALKVTFVFNVKASDISIALYSMPCVISE